MAQEIGMSEVNLYRCVRLNRIQAQDLERIARFLNVSIMTFFPDEAASTEVAAANNGKENDPNRGGRYVAFELGRLREKVAHLEQRIKDKDSQLADKNELIKLYRDKTEHCNR